MKRARLLPCLIGLLLILALPGQAAATYDPVGGGTTKLTLDPAFVRFLAQSKVTIEATAPARKRGNAIILPVSGGNFDPTIGKGEIAQEGAVVFRSARKRVPLRKLVVKAKRSPLLAKVGGSQLKLTEGAVLDSRRKGFGAALTAKRMELTAKVATRLNKKLRPARPFKEGQPFGSLQSTPQPLVATIVPSGRATVAFDPAFVSKLDQHFVSVNPIFPAEHLGPIFTLPIIAGSALAPDASLGTLRTGGEIEFLQLGAGQVFWQEPWFEPAARRALIEVEVQPTPAFPGKLGQIPALDLGSVAVASDPARRTISLSGIGLTLPAVSAATFNEAFAAGKGDFKAGELVGTLSFTAQAQ